MLSPKRIILSLLTTAGLSTSIVAMDESQLICPQKEGKDGSIDERHTGCSHEAIEKIRNKLKEMSRNQILNVKEDESYLNLLMCYLFDKISIDNLTSKLAAKKKSRAGQQLREHLKGRSAITAQDRAYFMNTLKLCSMTTSTLKNQLKQETKDRQTQGLKNPTPLEETLKSEIKRRQNLIDINRRDDRCNAYNAVETLFTKFEGKPVRRAEVEEEMHATTQSEKTYNSMMNLFEKRMAIAGKTFADDIVSESGDKQAPKRYGRQPVDVVRAQADITREIQGRIALKKQQEEDAERIAQGLAQKTLLIDISPIPGQEFQDADITQDSNFESQLKEVNNLINQYYQSKQSASDSDYIMTLKNLKSIAFTYRYAPLLAKLLSRSNALHDAIERAPKGTDWMSLYAFMVNGVINRQIQRTHTLNLGGGNDYNDIHVEFFSNLVVYEIDAYEKLNKALARGGDKHNLYKTYFEAVVNNPDNLEILLKRRWNMLIKALPFAMESHVLQTEFMDALSLTGCLIVVENHLQMILTNIEELERGKESPTQMLNEWINYDGRDQNSGQFLVNLFAQANEDNISTGIKISPDEFNKMKSNRPSNEDDDKAEQFLKEGNDPRIKTFYENTIRQSFPNVKENTIQKFLKQLPNIISNLRAIYN